MSLSKNINIGKTGDNLLPVSAVVCLIFLGPFNKTPITIDYISDTNAKNVG